VSYSRQREPNVRTFNRNYVAANNSDGADAAEGQGGRAPLRLVKNESRSRLEPKVIVPYKPRAGKPPRRIEIERRKRLFASQDVEQLLRRKGIDYTRYSVATDHRTGKPSHLPLEVFDDTSFESRSPSEWMDIGTTRLTGADTTSSDDSADEAASPSSSSSSSSSAETVTAVAGKGVRFGVDGVGGFVPCVASAYDEEKRQFLVTYNDTKETATLARVHLYFETEDPVVFVARVCHAHASRRTHEALIKQALFVDSMPTDEIDPLDTEQVNRILLVALNTKALSQMAVDPTALLNEVNIDYARTMNQIVFDMTTRDPAQAALRKTLGLDDVVDDVIDASDVSAAALIRRALKAAAETKKSAYNGVVAVPYHDFPKHFSDFCFNSLYTKVESISALVKVGGVERLV
jgi:dynein heavy chain